MSEGGNQQETNLVVPEDEDEDEEEDVDFNPFLKECSSPEASSSISSDDEGGDSSVVDNVASNLIDGLQDCMKKNGEVFIRSEVESESCDIERRNKRKFVSEESSANQHVEDGTEGVSKGLLHSDNVAMVSDEEDAICRRTRARYSLANCTLDELETFLQETDDDEDLHIVDDEQEYKKFLTAVLQGGENDEQSLEGNENVYDDDEDSDVDFEIELEEALDSDGDDNVPEKKNEGRRGGRRPKTRERNSNKWFLGQANKPLRPLVPIQPSTYVNLQGSTPNSFLSCPPSSQSGLVIGFTPHQIGQLHCLIHEHTQLLVQVFSLCVLDPSRKDIADETREMISELVQKRNKALSSRKVPYPDYCFRPPCIHSSVSDGLDGTPPIHQSHVPVDSSSYRPHFGVRGIGGPQVDCSKDAVWVPRVAGPVVSILDAAPLSLVGSYMDDVSRVVQEYQKCHVEGSYLSRFEKVPLFPIPNIPISPEANNKALRSSTSICATAPSSGNVDQSTKKSLAAALIENSKKQSIAFAPKEIVTLVQRFYVFFNSALYPHKPPPTPAANRVCFTDSEDKLLAMGIMEYNTDWEAIKQRFLPCKSKHQIFVRQKNRCSSKAPDNPIKAVRQMKTSPLNAEEKARIYQGLKIFKNDWVAVGKFMLPYRDPALLPRQWRIALGTQKSYKTDEAKRKKRHLYELQRRLRKAPVLTNCQTASEQEDNENINAAEGNKSDNDTMEDEEEAYVHEAFLADWRPGDSGPVPLENENACANQVGAIDSCRRLPSETQNVPSSLIPQNLQNGSHFTRVRYSASYTNHSSSDSLPKSSKSQVNLQPHGVGRKKDAQLVKLAPDLPPVNLPSSVRVISQSAFSSYRSASSQTNKISNTGAEKDKSVPTVRRLAKSVTTVSVDSANKGITPEDRRVNSDQLTRKDTIADTDLQMHPLLLRVPDDGRSPYCPVNSSTYTSNTFNFIEGTQLQANFNHLGKPSDADSTVDASLSLTNSSRSCTIDFHPLLQRNDDGNFGQHRNSSEPQATAPVSTSPDGVEDELDLEIHLSSTSRKRKVTTGRKVTAHNFDGLLNLGIIKETNEVERSGNFLTTSLAASSINQGHVHESHTLALSNNTSRFSGDHGSNQSFPDIVMEQEELSDSEEENGEDVEFECEEMDDSEREE